jgi:hypothetical protein
MSNRNANISKIETYLDSILKGKVSDLCYAGTLPSTLNTNATDMVLIDCGMAVNDYNSHCKGAVNIFLYAKPTSTGRKNVTLLSKMEKAFDEVLDNQESEIYKISELYRMSDYDTVYNMHYIIIAINLIII